MYDEEYALDDFVRVMKEKLNDEIQKINNRKNVLPGSLLYLDPIPTENYIFESLDSRTNNFTNFFVVFGFIDTPLREANESNFIIDLAFTFQVATFDKGEKEREILLRKLIRYRRAIISTVLKNPDIFRGYAKPILQSLRPISYPISAKKVMLTAGVNNISSITGN